jgi:hypothetical protein
MEPIHPNDRGHSPQVRGASGSIDGDPAFIQLVDAAWKAIQEYQTHPDALTVQTVMQTVNALNTYFSSHVPTDKDPAALAIYKVMTMAPPHGASLATYCADYGTTECATTVQYFLDAKQAGDDKFATLFNTFA